MMTMSEEIDWQTVFFARVVDLMVGLTETLVFQWKPKDFEVLSQLFVASLRRQRFPLGICFGILVFSSGRFSNDTRTREFNLCIIHALGRMSTLDDNHVIFPIIMQLWL